MERIKNALSFIFVILFCFMIVACEPIDPVDPIDPIEEPDNETTGRTLTELVVLEDSIVAGVGFSGDVGDMLWRIYVHLDEFNEFDDDYYVVIESWDRDVEDEYTIEMDETGYYFEFNGPSCEDMVRFNLMNEYGEIVDTTSSFFFRDDRDQLEVDVRGLLFCWNGNCGGFMAEPFGSITIGSRIGKGGVYKNFYNKEEVIICTESLNKSLHTINNRLNNPIIFLEFICGCDGEIERLYSKTGPIPVDLDPDGDGIGDYFEMTCYNHNYNYRYGCRDSETGKEYLMYPDGIFNWRHFLIAGYTDRPVICSNIYNDIGTDGYEN